MSGNVSYELQTFLGGVWKIDSVYDDRQIAVYEAQRLHGSGRYPAIRVVEEKYERSGKIATKTVFRAAKVDETNTDTIERQKTARQEVTAARKAAGAGEFKKGAGNPRAQKSGPGAVALTLILGSIVLAGILVIVGIRYLFGAI